jgi:peroxiredoxin
MHEDVKLKYISLFGVTAQKLDMKMIYTKTIKEAYVITKNKMLRDAWNVLNAKYHIRKG